MHGLIFAELKKFVGAKFGENTWEKLLENAGLKNNLYLASNVYPDQEILKLVTTACEMTGLTPNAALEAFGEFIAPDLVEQYKFLINPQWKLLDFLANTEETIHKIVRFHAGVTPPKLVTQRISDDTLTISYNSSRRMCALLKGIVKGAAAYYKEPASVLESQCMLHGDAECVVTVRVQSAAVRPGTTLPRADAVARH